MSDRPPGDAEKLRARFAEATDDELERIVVSRSQSALARALRDLLVERGRTPPDVPDAPPPPARSGARVPVEPPGSGFDVRTLRLVLGLVPPRGEPRRALQLRRVVTARGHVDRGERVPQRVVILGACARARGSDRSTSQPSSAAGASASTPGATALRTSAGPTRVEWTLVCP